MVIFTPKKVLDVFDFHNIKFTHLVKKGLDRSYFIPRYKKGSHKLKDLDYSYTKTIRDVSIERIANVLIEEDLFEESDRGMIVRCFYNDDYEPMYGDII